MSHGIFGSLRVRLSLLVLLAVIPTVGLMLHTNLEQRRRSADDVTTNAVRMARLIAGIQQHLIEEVHRFLIDLAELPEVRAQSPRACSERLGRMLRYSASYANLGAVNPEGHWFCSALPITQLTSVAERPWFQRTLQTRAFSVGEYQIDTLGKSAEVHFGYPVIDDYGRIQAVITASLDLDWLNALTAEEQLPEGMALIVIDRNGMILARYPEPEKWVGRVLPEDSIVKAMLTGREGVEEVAGVDGIPRVFAFAPVSAGSQVAMYVSIGVPEAVAFADVKRILNYNLIGMGLVTVLVLTAAWVGGNVFVLRNVKALVGATRRLAAGDLSARTGMPHGPGELSHLARAFDDMAASLERGEAERKRARESLRESEERYRQLVELSPDAITISRNARIVYINEAGLRLFGATTPEQILGDPLFAYIHPDYRALVREQNRKLVELKQPLRSIELKVFRLDGSVVEIEVSASPLPFDGGVAVQSILRDITKRKRVQEALQESEARYRSLSESSPIGIFQADAEGRCLYTNARWQEIAGLTLEESLGDGWASAILPEDRNRVLADWTQAVRDGREFSREFRFRRPGGDVRWVHGRAAPVRSDAGDIVSYVGTDADITESKRAEDKLREYAARLETLSRRLVEIQESERRQIARELHDEIGEIVTGLKLALEASARLPSDQVAGNLGEAQALVQDLMTRTRELSLDLRPAILDDLGLLPALLWHFERYTGQTNVRVTFEHSGLENRLPSDLETAAYRIVQEALTNVARHAKAKEVTVRLWTNPDTLGVQVEDLGTGFESETALDAHASSGLTGMRERAMLLGGRLKVDSSPGRGTRVMAEFPLHRALEPERVGSSDD